MNTKPNPRWKKAPIELFFVSEAEFMEPEHCGKPYRFASWKDADNGQAIPPFLVKQPDGTWQENFFPDQAVTSE